MDGAKRLALALWAAAGAGPFTEVGGRSALSVVVYGPVERKDFILEATGGGIALVDFDEDGWLDLLVPSGTRLGAGAAGSPGAVTRAYRNRRDGTFAPMVLGVERSGWPSSITAGDFDGDGHVDLFLTYWNANVLYRWRDGRYEDVTATSGLPAGKGWWSGAAFLDYDRDGDLDLFVTQYLAEFDPATAPRNCRWKGVVVNCGPRGLAKGRHFLFRNRGGGVFEDVTAASGVGAAPPAYAMTAVAADYNEDGWIDLYVACDSTPSVLFVNQRDGTFREEGLERGVAVSGDGLEQAGMGVALGDVNRDGHLDIFKTNFADDTHNLYVNSGDGHFVERAGAEMLAGDKRHMGWGASLADFDNDGWADLFYVTGSVFPEVERKLPQYPHRGPRMFFRSLGASGGFARVPLALAAQSSRGAAFGDIDNDGDVDAVILNMNATPTVLRNDWAARRNHWLMVDLGPRGVGATVVLTVGGRRTARVATSQESFYSVNDSRVHFGLGAAESGDVEVHWTDGRVTVHMGLAAGRVHRVSR